MQINLSQQAILVTGASRGIGAAIARRIGEAGGSVAIHYGRAREQAEALADEIGNGAHVFGADLRNPAACASLWSEVQRHFGRVDAVVNNAGIALDSDLSKNVGSWIEDWDHTMAVNLTSTAVISRDAIAHFQERGGGRIVNISSRAAFRGDQPNYLAYAASKAGVVALTRSIARGFGRHGIKAFTVAPGFTRTEMAQAFIEQFGEEYAASDLALPRLTEPDDIAPMVAFLLSGLADHATGATIDINAASYVR